MLLGKGPIAAVCLVLGGCLPVFAAETSLDETESAYIVSEPEKKSWWLASHETVSETIGEWSTSIDTFLSGAPSRYDPESHLQIRFGSVLGEEQSSGFFDFKTRLRLPNTQDRLRLVIESEKDSLAPESLRGESSQDRSIFSSALATSVSAAVQYLKEDIGLEVDSGIRVDFPLDPFLRIRFNQAGDDKTWGWWQRQEAFAYYSRGVGVSYGLGLGYQQSATLRYGIDASITWLDKENRFYARENVSLQHILNEKSRLSYQLSFLQSGQHDLEPETVLYSVQYERQVYRDWLIVQVRPQFTHEADNDYDSEFSLTLALAIFLGPDYLD